MSPNFEFSSEDICIKFHFDYRRSQRINISITESVRGGIRGRRGAPTPLLGCLRGDCAAEDAEARANEGRVREGLRLRLFCLLYGQAPTTVSVLTKRLSAYETSKAYEND